MIIFFLVAVLLVGLSLALMLPGLRSRTAADASVPDREVIGIARERLAALDAQVAAGELSEAEAAEERAAVERSLLNDLDSAPATQLQPPAPATYPWRTAVALAAMVPLVAGTVYLTLGQPLAIQHAGMASPGAAVPPGHEKVGPGAQDMDAVIAKLKTRLEENPNDAQGWWLLARSFRALNRQNEALLALQKAREIMGDNPDLLVQLADTLAVTRGRSLAGEPAELVRKALAIEPNHVVGLWLAGTAEFQAGNGKQALEYWNRLRPLLADDKNALAQLDSAIADVTGKPVAAAAPAVTPKAAAAGGAGNGVRVKVTLAAPLRDEVKSDQTVFVIARALEGAGPPIAVAKRLVAELPFEMDLDDSLAMSPQARISTQKMVKISARISRSGTPAAQSGDYYGEIAAVAVGSEKTAALQIDQRVP